MKKTATLLFMFACGCAMNAHAKTTRTTASTPFPHFSNQEPGSNSITINTRLVKKTRYKYAGIATYPIANDEVLYEYNSDRGSTVDIYDQTDDGVLYDVSYSNVILQGGVQKKLERLQHYNTNGNVDILSYLSWKSNTYKDSIYYTYTYYNQFKNIIDQANLGIHSGTITNFLYYQNTVNPQGNVIEMHCYGTNYYIEFQYDAAGRLQSQYDLTIVGSAYNYNEKDSFVYDGLGRTSEYYVFLWNNNNWKIDQQWLYSYSVANDLATITKNKWSGSSFVNDALQSFNYTNHNLISDITDKWNSSTNVYDHYLKLSWIYNLNSQPLQLNTYSWVNNNWNTTVTDYQIVWEYETYFPTAIYDVNNDVNTNLYPVPAGQSVNLALSWKKVQPFNVTITDMAGRTVTQWDENAVPEYHKNIPVDNLPSGNYFVVLTGKEGIRSTQKFQVAH